MLLSFIAFKELNLEYILICQCVFSTIICIHMYIGQVKGLLYIKYSLIVLLNTNYHELYRDGLACNIIYTIGLLCFCNPLFYTLQWNEIECYARCDCDSINSISNLFIMIVVDFSDLHRLTSNDL